MSDPIEDRVEAVLTLLYDHGQTDGNHHKAWVIDQTARLLLGPSYEQWVEDYEHGDEGGPEYVWDAGIAP